MSLFRQNFIYIIYRYSRANFAKSIKEIPRFNLFHYICKNIEPFKTRNCSIIQHRIKRLPNKQSAIEDRTDINMEQNNTYPHPEWSYSAVLYEMNIRQLTPQGTFAAAMERLPFLRDLGIDAIWLMPVYPIGVEGRKGSLGSYYSIRDYCAINPEFGTMEDFEALIAEYSEDTAAAEYINRRERLYFFKSICQHYCYFFHTHLSFFQLPVYYSIGFPKMQDLF